MSAAEHDRLTAPAAAREILDRVRGLTSVRVIPVIDSTNLELRRRIEGGTLGEATLLIADAQTSGRGRRGRTWHSPPGVGLYASLAVRPTGPAEHWPRWSLAASVAVCEACRGRCRPPEPVVDWPNDVVVAGRKLGGILVDAWGGAGGAWMVLGWGVNVGHRETDFPPDLAASATSLRIQGGSMLDRVELVSEVVERLLDLGAALEVGDWDRVRADWLRLAPDAVGARVRTADGPGTTAGIDDRGALIVRLDEEARSVVVHGSDSVAPCGPP